MKEPDEKDSPYVKREHQTFIFICQEKLSNLLINHKLYNLTYRDIHLFLYLSLEGANNSLSIKIKSSWLSSIFDVSQEYLQTSILKLRYADLIRKKEHSFMINPDYVKFGRKQIQALQRVNWAKLKPHSRSETHSIEVIKKLKKDIHL